MTYHDKRKEAESLRKKGYSYGLIKEKVGVSKSTLSYWLRAIPYTPNKKTIEYVGKAQAASSAVKSKQKRDSVEKAREIAKTEIGKLNERDIFLLGVGLYIGEGSKSQDSVRVINSNADVMKVMVKWFKTLGASTKNFSIAIHLYPDNDVGKCLDYWSKMTTIPRSQFGKTQIDKRVNKKKGKRGKLPYGTAHLSVRSRGNKELGSFLARKIEGYSREVVNQILRD